MGKPHRAIFHEFQGGSYAPDDVEGSGDVKYHLGASSDREFDGNKVHLSLTANPSHLEIVDPVVMGKARAKQDQLPAAARRDRAAGAARQGACRCCCTATPPSPARAWSPNASACRACAATASAGTMHFIVNNQIGFTTNPRFSRSSPYPSDVAMMIEAPIFHVNGDDPEAVVYAAKVATEFRMKFDKAVVVDMFCYRRFGHNEGDEPTFTQPMMYRKIRSHTTTVQIYAEQLIAEGVITPGRGRQDEGRLARASRGRVRGRQGLQAEQGRLAGRRVVGPAHGRPAGRAAPRQDRRAGQDAEGHRQEADRRSRRASTSTRPSAASSRTAAGMIETGEGIDWATGRGAGLRLDPARRQSRPPVRPGFRARHLLPAPLGLFDQSDENRYIPLNNLSPAQADFEVINSMLSEEAVLGFEYGYSLAEPNALTLWEAQFGDFANGAQVVFDQFISSGERKWLRMSGLVCCCRTATRARGRSTPRPASSASCSSAPRTTCRSSTAPRRRTTSTSCAASCSATSASR